MPTIVRLMQISLSICDSKKKRKHTHTRGQDVEALNMPGKLDLMEA